MIRRFRGASPLLVALLFALESNCAPRAQPSATAPPGLVTISIVGTNDLHGGLLEREGRGGLALLGGYLKQLRDVRARDGGAVLALDAGDMFQGTLESNLTEGASVVAAYNALGYTAAAVGNHEFDFGPVGPASTPRSAADDPRGALKARAAEAAFPFLAANLIDTTTGQTVAWRNVQPTTIVRAAGISVGIIGLGGSAGGDHSHPHKCVARSRRTARRRDGPRWRAVFELRTSRRSLVMRVECRDFQYCP